MSKARLKLITREWRDVMTILHVELSNPDRKTCLFVPHSLFLDYKLAKLYLIDMFMHLPTLKIAQLCNKQKMITFSYGIPLLSGVVEEGTILLLFQLERVRFLLLFSYITTT